MRERTRVQKNIRLSRGVVFLARWKKRQLYLQHLPNTSENSSDASVTDRKRVLVNFSLHVNVEQLRRSADSGQVKTLVWPQTEKRKMSSICKYYRTSSNRWGKKNTEKSETCDLPVFSKASGINTTVEKSQLLFGAVRNVQLLLVICFVFQTLTGRTGGMTTSCFALEPVCHF